LPPYPVESVSWDDVQEFIKKLNEKNRSSGYLYRFPTEAEWEYSCRGGAVSEEECSYHFYFEKPTNDLSSHLANFDGNLPFDR
jgi:formylglycine-generating enzyme required for sulfatase activity